MARTDSGYTEAVGRRKTASARVRLTAAKNTSFVVNDRALDEYFPKGTMVDTVHAPLKVAGGSYTITVKVAGGGHKAQAEAIRHGISRALCVIIPDVRKELKVRGWLTRDPRAKERKKFGLKAARRAPQWSKR